MLSKIVIFSKKNSELNFLAILALIPLLAFLGNWRWLVPISQIDAWFYFGHFNNFLNYWDNWVVTAKWAEYMPDTVLKYYGTRVPYSAPGAIIYWVFGSEYGRYIFNLLVIYPLITVGLYSLAKNYTNKNRAQIAVLIFLCNPYFYQFLSSDYVNKGILAYQILILISISRAVRKNEKLTWTLVGFLILCTIAVQLSSILFVVLYFLHFRQMRKFNSLEKNVGINQVIRYTALGFFIGIIFWQVIFSLYTNSNEFFLWYQIVLSLEPGLAKIFAASISLSASKGYFNVFNWTILFLSISQISIRKFSLKNRYLVYSRYLILTVLSMLVFNPYIYALYVTIDMYAAFFYILNFFVIVSIIDSIPVFKIKRKILVNAGFLIGIYLILDSSNSFNQRFLNISALQLALYISLTFIIFMYLSASYTKLYRLGVPLVILANIVTPIEFTGEASVVKAHNFISQVNVASPPSIWWNTLDRNRKGFESIAASFTEKAWWIRGTLSENCEINSEQYLNVNRVVLLTSLDFAISSKEQIQKCYSGKLRFINQAVIKGNKGSYLVVNYSLTE